MKFANLQPCQSVRAMLAEETELLRHTEKTVPSRALDETLVHPKFYSSADFGVVVVCLEALLDDASSFGRFVRGLLPDKDLDVVVVLEKFSRFHDVSSLSLRRLFIHPVDLCLENLILLVHRFSDPGCRFDANVVFHFRPYETLAAVFTLHKSVPALMEQVVSHGVPAGVEGNGSTVEDALAWSELVRDAQDFDVDACYVGLESLVSVHNN